MKINRKELLHVLNLVQPGLDKSETVEQSNTFVFQDEQVFTFNDEVAVIVDYKTDFEGAVQAEELYKLLSKVPEEEMELVGSENELKVKGKKARAGIRFNSEIELPIEEIGKPKKWHELPENFLEGLQMCVFSTATTGLASVLGCVHVKDDIVESCDDFRLTEFVMSAELNEEDELLIPAGPAKHLIANKVTEYATTDGWLHFRDGDGLRFACRTIDGDFPDLEDLLKVSGTQVTLPDDLKPMLDRAGIFTTEEFGKNERVDIEMKKGALIVSGEGPAGWYKERTKVKFSSDTGIKFAVQPRFLIQVVDLLDTVLIGKSKLLLKGDGFKHVVALLGE